MNDEFFWAIARSTGATAMVLLSVSVALGIATRSAKTLPGVPRFAVQNIHRSTSLFALLFTLVHVVSLLFDKYAQLNLVDLLIPFISQREPFWYGLGTLAFDLLLALAITGILRARISDRLFHLVHWGAYACWPIALVHGLGAGSDTGQKWFLALTLASVALVFSAVIWRLQHARKERTHHLAPNRSVL